MTGSYKTIAHSIAVNMASGRVIEAEREGEKDDRSR